MWLINEQVQFPCSYICDQSSFGLDLSQNHYFNATDMWNFFWTEKLLTFSFRCHIFVCEMLWLFCDKFFGWTHDWMWCTVHCGCRLDRCEIIRQESQEVRGRGGRERRDMGGGKWNYGIRDFLLSARWFGLTGANMIWSLFWQMLWIKLLHWFHQIDMIHRTLDQCNGAMA